VQPRRRSGKNRRRGDSSDRKLVVEMRHSRANVLDMF
jgi:hypothetical protein